MEAPKYQDGGAERRRGRRRRREAEEEEAAVGRGAGSPPEGPRRPPCRRFRQSRAPQSARCAAARGGSAKKRTEPFLTLGPAPVIESQHR